MYVPALGSSHHHTQWVMEAYIGQNCEVGHLLYYIAEVQDVWNTTSTFLYAQ